MLPSWKTRYFERSSTDIFEYGAKRNLYHRRGLERQAIASVAPTIRRISLSSSCIIGAGLALTGGGFWRDLMPGHGTCMVRVGAGAVWGRVGTLASPCVPTRHPAWKRDPSLQGDASVPTPPSTTPAPTRMRPLPQPPSETPTRESTTPAPTRDTAY